MENKKNMVIYYSIGAVVVVAIIIFWLMSKKVDAPVVGVDQNIDQTALTPTEDLSNGSVNAVKSTPAISYKDALIKYKDTRIQLDSRCQATPNNVTYKNNVFIMIDNRSSAARTVKIGSVYSVKAYGFKIIKLSSANLPVTWLMDCDKSQNVATILLQK